MKFFTCAFLFLVTLQFQGQSLNDAVFNKLHSKEHLIEDFDIFKTGLEKIHPALYRYRPKQQMDSIFNEVRLNISQDMRYAEFYKKITLLPLTINRMGNLLVYFD